MLVPKPDYLLNFGYIEIVLGFLTTSRIYLDLVNGARRIRLATHLASQGGATRGTSWRLLSLSHRMKCEVRNTMSLPTPKKCRISVRVGSVN